MALVTVQRSPSVADSPQCSNSDGEEEDDEGIKNDKSECFFAGKGTALVLALKDVPQYAERRLSTDSTRSTNSTQSNNSDIQQHLQSMFYLLRHEETLKMAVKLESQRPNRTRYLVIASRTCYRSASSDRRVKIVRHNSARTSTATNMTIAAATTTIRQMSVDNNSNKYLLQQQEQPQQQQQQQSQMEANENSNEPADRRISSSSTNSNRQSIRCCDATDQQTASGDSKSAEGIEESCLLGIDCNERATIGLVVPILADTTIHLDGDGGFSVAVYGKTHIFKPVSVQAMWSALQTLHKVSQKARENNFYPGGPSHDWLSYYERRIESDQSCLNEWNAMDSLESRRPPSPDAIRNKPTAKEETESVIKMKLKEIMMSVDLDEVTSKYIRGRLEEHLDMDLGEYKSFIDEEMLMILGQMDAPTEIFEHVYLGSEWNASNLEELQKNGVRHILNVTREIDNFFPGMFDYFNVRVYDDEKTNLLKHWDNTFRYITRAKSEGSKVLVHCKMGVSRSASVVIAYAMKAYNWEFQQALQHVKERRNCIKPNKNFLNQLETYRGMLDAMKNKEKLQRSKSETNLKSTKDARLLPGSEPTPLIQALNQSKSKSAGHGVSNEAEVGGSGVGAGEDIACVRNIHGASNQKQRRLVRRSSSTSPIQNHTAIVMKQQSQSLENLTPERSIADEPKNVRYPGSNGENYSVTQNQVLHIQKNTPPPLPSAAISTPPTSVRNIVHDLETGQEQTRKTADDRKTLNLQLGRSISQDTNARFDSNESGGGSGGSPVWTSSAKLITQTSNLTVQRADGLDAVAAPLRSSLRYRRVTTGSTCGGGGSDAGDVFSSQVDNVFAKEEEEKRHHHSRKTQSWAATSGPSGGIVMDATNMLGTSASAAAKLGSNSSIESGSSNVTTASGPTVFEGVVRTRPRQRELPLRHASWGSGDNRYGIPTRNSSWSSYDTNRNTFQYGGTATSAIFEGQIHELNMSNKTATQHDDDANAADENQPHHQHHHHHHHHIGTVKRTKQKLEECTVLKKLCQDNDGGSAGEGTIPNTTTTTTTTILLPIAHPQKRNTNLYRSASAAGSCRARYPLRCNSDEIRSLQRVVPMRRSDGSKPLNAELFSASAPESYTMSDIENKNMMLQAETDAVELRTSQKTTTTTEDHRISGNVQILKKNFEAKAGGATTNAVASQTTAGKKGHQSLPSSPVAQHVDHSVNSNETTTTSTSIPTPTAITTTEQQPATATTTAVTSCSSTSSTSSSASSSSSSSLSNSSSVSESCDRNVKCLVHKYQTTSTTTANIVSITSAPPPISTSTAATAVVATSTSKPRPRSYYENLHSHKFLTGKPHDYSDSRPPPAPVKSSCSSSTSSSTHHTHHLPTPPQNASMTETIIAHQQQNIQQQQQHHHQQRRLQQHGKTHPLARLSLPKHSFNSAAYNTM